MYNKDSRKYGFYPATRCLKIKGQFGNSHIWYYSYCNIFTLKILYVAILLFFLDITKFLVKSKETLTIRTCVVDGGSAWGTDEEFARRDPSLVASSSSWQSTGQFEFVRSPNLSDPKSDLK